MSHPGDHKTLHGLLLTSLYTVHTNLTDRTIGYGGMVQRSDTYCNPLAYQSANACWAAKYLLSSTHLHILFDATDCELGNRSFSKCPDGYVALITREALLEAVYRIFTGPVPAVREHRTGVDHAVRTDHQKPHASLTPGSPPIAEEAIGSI